MEEAWRAGRRRKALHADGAYDSHPNWKLKYVRGIGPPPGPAAGTARQRAGEGPRGGRTHAELVAAVTPAARPLRTGCRHPRGLPGSRPRVDPLGPTHPGVVLSALGDAESARADQRRGWYGELLPCRGRKAQPCATADARVSRSVAPAGSMSCPEPCRTAWRGQGHCFAHRGGPPCVAIEPPTTTFDG